MKFKCDRDVLRETTAYLSKYTTRLGINEALKCIHMTLEGDNLRLQSISGVVFIGVTTSVEGTEDGSVLVSGGMLSTSIATLGDGDIAVSSKKKWLIIKRGKQTRRIAIQDAEGFPLAPKTGEDVVVTVNSDELLESMKCVGFARSETLVQPIMRGYYMDLADSGMIITADGQRAAFSETGIKSKGSLVVAPEGIEALRGALGLSIVNVDDITIHTTHPGWIKITAGPVDLRIASISGAFPAQAINMLHKLKSQEGGTSVYLSKHTMAPIVAMACSLAMVATKTQASGAVLLTTSEGSITFSMDVSDAGGMDDTLDVEIVGSDVIVKLHPEQLQQALQSSPEDTVEMKIWGPVSPVLLQSGDWSVIQAPMGDRDVAEEWERRKQVEQGEQKVEVEGAKESITPFDTPKEKVYEQIPLPTVSKEEAIEQLSSSIKEMAREAKMKPISKEELPDDEPDWGDDEW